MSIVFITIPGDQKRDFINTLHKETASGVSYVIIQKPKKFSLIDTVKRLVATVGWSGLPKECWYALILRLNKRARHYLSYFRAYSDRNHSTAYFPPVLEVDSVNSDEVYTLLKKLKPRIIVVWGTAVIKPHIFKIAEHTINLHMGLGEHYRGAVANHFAVLHDERQKVGATIHYVHEKVDTGDALATITAPYNLPPKEFFTKLNDSAERTLLSICIKLWKGEQVPAVPQRIATSRNVFLREWIPSKRYQVAKKLEAWEKKARGTSN